MSALYCHDYFLAESLKRTRENHCCRELKVCKGVYKLFKATRCFSQAWFGVSQVFRRIHELLTNCSFKGDGDGEGVASDKRCENNPLFLKLRTE